MKMKNKNDQIIFEDNLIKVLVNKSVDKLNKFVNIR